MTKAAQTNTTICKGLDVTRHSTVLHFAHLMLREEAVDSRSDARVQGKLQWHPSQNARPARSSIFLAQKSLPCFSSRDTTHGKETVKPYVRVPRTVLLCLYDVDYEI